MRGGLAQVLRLLVLLLLSALSLQIYFLGRVALMAVANPQSTSLQRSEAWRLLTQQQALAWSQHWVEYAQIAPALKRAVIASEDAGFTAHRGVEWEAIDKAWERNRIAEDRSEKMGRVPIGREKGGHRDKAGERLQRGALALGREASPSRAPARPEPKVVGGSTITQQLAKNLFLSGERNWVRKGQEFVVTLMLEALLPKQRILEIYLNSVEWGEGVFGAEAAARHYFHASAAQLKPAQAAQLAVMLPAPKRFEKRPGSGYVVGRAGTVAARMGSVDVP